MCIRDSFNGLHENNKESILEVQFTGSLEGGHYEYNLFTFGFTVKLLPPFAYVVQFGVEVYKDFNLLAVLVEFIAGGCIDS